MKNCRKYQPCKEQHSAAGIGLRALLWSSPANSGCDVRRLDSRKYRAGRKRWVGAHLSPYLWGAVPRIYLLTQQRPIKSLKQPFLRNCEQYTRGRASLAADAHMCLLSLFGSDYELCRIPACLYRATLRQPGTHGLASWPRDCRKMDVLISPRPA